MRTIVVLVACVVLVGVVAWCDGGSARSLGGGVDVCAMGAGSDTTDGELGPGWCHCANPGRPPENPWWVDLALGMEYCGWFVEMCWRDGWGGPY